MTAELPELERLLVEAAARRRHGLRRGWRSRRIRADRVSGAAIAVGALALVVAFARPPANDERAVEAVSSAQVGGQERLASAFRAFGQPAIPLGDVDPKGLPLEALDQDAVPHPSPGSATGEHAQAVISAGRPVLDPGRPIVERILYERDAIRIAAWTGTAYRTDTELTCFPRWIDGVLGAGQCASADEMLASRGPFVILSEHSDRTGYSVATLVRDDIIAMTARFRDGKTERVAITGNVAYVQSTGMVCALTWTDRDGTGGEVATDLPSRCG